MLNIFEVKIQFLIDQISNVYKNRSFESIKMIYEKNDMFFFYFQLVVNESARIKFDSTFFNISASGFDPTKENNSVWIEAIPTNKQWERKQSNEQVYCIL